MTSNSGRTSMGHFKQKIDDCKAVILCKNPARQGFYRDGYSQRISTGHITAGRKVKVWALTPASSFSKVSSETDMRPTLETSVTETASGK